MILIMQLPLALDETEAVLDFSKIERILSPAYASETGRPRFKGSQHRSLLRPSGHWSLHKGNQSLALQPALPRHWRIPMFNRSISSTCLKLLHD